MVVTGVWRPEVGLTQNFFEPCPNRYQLVGWFQALADITNTSRPRIWPTDSSRYRGHPRPGDRRRKGRDHPRGLDLVVELAAAIGSRAANYLLKAKVRPKLRSLHGRGARKGTRRSR